MTKTYLGDSVYATFDGYQIRLTTENGYGPSNEIFMEGPVVEAFMRYVEKSFKVEITTRKLEASQAGTPCDADFDE